MLDPIVREISLVPNMEIVLYFVLVTILSIALVIAAVSAFKDALSSVESNELLLFNVPNSASL